MPELGEVRRGWLSGRHEKQGIEAGNGDIDLLQVVSRTPSLRLKPYGADSPLENVTLEEINCRVGRRLKPLKLPAAGPCRFLGIDCTCHQYEYCVLHELR